MKVWFAGTAVLGAFVSVAAAMPPSPDCEGGALPEGLPEALGAAAADEPDDVVAYARTCREELGVPADTVIRPMNCLQGTEVPITIQVQNPDGTWTNRALRTGNDAADLAFYEDLRRVESRQPLAPGRAPVRCLNAQWLGGSCWNYAHVQRIQISPDVEAVLMCRQKRFTNPWDSARRIAAYNADPSEANFRLAFEFNDVGLIWTNTRTGKTCWFDQLGSFYGGWVPSPDHDAPVDRAEALRRHLASGAVAPPAGIADSYWNRTGRTAFKTPSGIAGDGCQGCHAGGPWVVSPWVREANVVPGNSEIRRIPYITVQYGGYFTRYRSFAITTGPVLNPATGVAENQRCTSCHRIGATGNPATGLSLDPQFTRATTGGALAFMPDGHTATDQADYDRRYAHHIRALRCCAENPNRLGCYRQDLSQSPLQPPVAGTEEPRCANPRPPS